MDDKELDVQQDVAETTPDSSPETEQPELEQTDDAVASEPVDEKGVPLKNRVAEQERKLRARISELEAQSALLNQTPTTTPAIPANATQEEAIKIVQDIASKETRKALEPLLAKQFLADNPDARDMIEDINRVRRENPEISGIEKLEVAYKVAKAEKLEQELLALEDKKNKATQQIKESQGQGAIEGTGKSKAPAASLAERIAKATTQKELEELEQYLKQ